MEPNNHPNAFSIWVLKIEDEDDPYLHSIIFEKKTTTSYDSVLSLTNWRSLVEDELKGLCQSCRSVDTDDLIKQANDYIQSASKFQKNKNAVYIVRDHLIQRMLEDSEVLNLFEKQNISKVSMEDTINLKDMEARENKIEDTEYIKYYTKDLTQMARRKLGMGLLAVKPKFNSAWKSLCVTAKQTLFWWVNLAWENCSGRGLAVLLAKSDPANPNEEKINHRKSDEKLAKYNGIPPVLAGARILSLDIGALRSGAKYRGELEERIKIFWMKYKCFKNPLFFH